MPPSTPLGCVGPALKNLEVNEDPTAEVFPDMIFVLCAIILIKSVPIAFLPVADGSPTGGWARTRYGRVGKDAFGFRRLVYGGAKRGG